MHDNLDIITRYKLILTLNGIFFLSHILGAIKPVKSRIVTTLKLACF